MFTPVCTTETEFHLSDAVSFTKIAPDMLVKHLTTIADPWYFWKGICLSKAHKPVTLSGNHTFTKV